jgi:AbrB family looped-hinge helix DNA binding protein
MSITKMDTNGRILLPAGIRDKLDLNDGDRLAIDQLGDGTIILKLASTKTVQPKRLSNRKTNI